MQPNRCRRVTAFLLAIILAHEVHADEVDDALTLLRQGKAEQAYRLLAPWHEKRRGDIRYSVMEGIVALESGRAEIAIRDFEFTLGRNPALTAVRADLGRAYLASGRFADAAREFRRVLSEHPPESARPFLERALAAAETGARVKAYGILTGHVEGGYGRNSNVTAVTSSFTSGVQGAYGLPGFQPTGNSVLRTENFSQVDAGLDYMKPSSQNWAFIAGLSELWRGYDGLSAYNETSTNISAGMLYSEGKHLLRVSANAEAYDQKTLSPGVSANRRAKGISADWRYNYDPLINFGAFGAVNRIRYPDIAALDVNETQLGLSVTRRFLSLPNASLTFSPSYTADHAVNKIPGSATGADYSKHVTGARLSGQFDPAASVTGYFSLGYYSRSDDSNFARSTLIARGTDDETDYVMGANWRFSPGWSLNMQLSRTENRSNIALYSYNSTQTFIGLRRDFR